VVYTHLGCFGAPGGAGGGGIAFIRCQTNHFFPIRQAVPDGLAWPRFCSWARCARFFMVKFCINVYTVYLHVIYHFINRWGHDNGWMA
jgi:hypothetical protein